MLSIRSGLLYGAIAIFAVFACSVVLSAEFDYVRGSNSITRTFLIVFGIAWGVSLTRVGGVVEQFLYKLAQRSGMVVTDDAATEAVRVNLIRIVVGFLFFLRSGWIAEDVLRVGSITDWNSPAVMATLLMLLTSACIMLGILTPIFCLLSTVLLFWHIDAALQTQTLGTYVLLMIIMTCAFLPAGTALSVDAWLARRSAIWKVVLGFVYAPFGRPSIGRSGVLRFLSFISYSLVCLYSSLFHIDDPAWIEGFANLQALTSTFLGRQHEFFQQFYNLAPATTIWLSKITGWGMIVWEMFLIPLVLASRWTRIAAITWGVLFFLCSLFLFNLSFLPYYEFAFWALLFLPATSRRVTTVDTRIEVFFDDRCNLCDRTMRFLMAADVFNVIAPRPASQCIERIREVGLTYESAMTDLYGWDTAARQLRGGFDFYLLVTKRVLLLKPLRLVLLFLDAIRIGRPAYRWIAERRRRLFGVCQFSNVREKEDLVDNILAPPNSKFVLFRGVPLSHIALALAFITLLPHSPVRGASLPSKTEKKITRMARAALNYGIGEINVFNQTDLMMSSTFFVVFRVAPNGNLELVPYHGYRGERLGMDASDTFLYGVSAVWRRSMIQMPDPCYEDSDQRQVGWLSKIIHYDQAVIDPDPAKYVLRYYRISNWDYDLLRKFSHQDFETRSVCEVTVDASTAKVIEKNDYQELSNASQVN